MNKQPIRVERLGRTPTTTVELVHVPADGGYYLSNVDFKLRQRRMSLKVYPSREAAIADWNGGSVQYTTWEQWA